MPELPEAETLKRQLEKTVKGKKITKVVVNKARVIKKPSAVQFQKELTGATIKDIFRKGKALILKMSSGKNLVVQLGMTGQLIYPGGGSESRVSFELNDNKLLDFNDTRMFGGLCLLDDWKDLAYFKKLGPEPFNIDLKQFKEMLSKKPTRIKLLLMDQEFISGVGNIYANEALFRSKVSPGRAAKSLSAQEAVLLFKEIRNTLNEAIDYQGSSVDSYVQLTGEAGNYVPQLKIYDREGEKCLRCGRKVKKIVLGGRGTYFCPRCQK